MNKKTSDSALIIALLFFILSQLIKGEPAQSTAAIAGFVWVILSLTRLAGE